MRISAISNNFTNKNSHKQSFGEIFIEDKFWLYNGLSKKDFPEFDIAIQNIADKYPDTDCFITVERIRDSESLFSNPFKNELIFEKKGSCLDTIRKTKKNSDYYKGWNRNPKGFMEFTHFDTLYYAAKLSKTMNETLPKLIEQGYKTKEKRDNDLRERLETCSYIDSKALGFQNSEFVWNARQDASQELWDLLKKINPHPPVYESRGIDLPMNL